MTKRILALLLTLALVLPAVSCDVLLADPNGPGTPSDSQSANNNTPPSDTEKAPGKGPEVHTQPQTPPDSEPEDSEPPMDWPDEPETDYYETESEYIPQEFTVTFVLEGYDDEFGIQVVKEGDNPGRPTVNIDPAIGTFDDVWYTHPSCKDKFKFDFSTPITEDITLYGRFVPNPAAPALLITPEQLAEQASERSGYAYGIASADVMTNGSNSFVRLTASNGDPYFMAAQNCGMMPDYLAIRYRTNSELGGEMFIGSGNGPHGGGDHAIIDWTGDNEWHLAIIHLPSCGATTIQNGVIDYFRLDLFRGFSEGAYIDIAYIAFFNSPEYAKDYDSEKYKAPMWDANRDVVVHQSFDQLYAGTGEPGSGTENVFTPGQSADWDGIVNLPDFSVETLTYWGWIAYCGELGQFGYQINGGTPVYDDAFSHETWDDVIMAAVGCGGDNGQRMKIAISLAGLEGENTVRTLYRNARGDEICLSEFTVILPMKPKDLTDTFVSHVTYNAVDTPINQTDLSKFFQFGLNLGDYRTTDSAYKINGISEMFADVVGKYAFTVGIQSTPSVGAAFVRGYHSVHSADLPAMDPEKNLYVINNYYETDGDNYMGGAGIFSTLADGNLYILIKKYDAECLTHVKNFICSVGNMPTSGNLTMADDGETVSILVDGKLYATIALSGSTTYEKIVDLPEGAAFAQTAVVTLVDGTVHTVENTLVAATCNAQIGFTVRGGDSYLTAVKVEAFSSITIDPMNPNKPVIPEEPSLPEAGDATISFADHTYRVEEGEDYQIFANDGFVFTQYKGESTTWNTQRINPIRLYPQQVITFEYSNMDKLVVTVNNTTYVNKLISVISDDNTQVTVDGTNVTIQFITPVDYYELTLFAGQVRVDRVSVYAAEANDEFEPEAPVYEMPAEFCLSMYQAMVDSTLYFTGAMAGNYLATSENPADAVKLYSEKVGNGYRMYFVDGGVKYYVEIYDRGSGRSGVQITNAPSTVYTWSDEINTWVTTLGDISYWLGTYNKFTTISASKAVYITEENTGVSQFPVVWDQMPVDPSESVLVIDPRTLPAGSITGHMPVIVNAENQPNHFPMIAAAGLESGAMIHQGSIYLGEFDLTKYEKVIIYFATDWGEGTQSGLAAAKEQGFGYLGLSAWDNSNVVNPDRSGFIGEPYTPDGGWVITAHELTNVAASGYSGPLYVSADFLGGQFIIIDRVEFIAK